jgi:hypothetical protein
MLENTLPIASFNGDFDRLNAERAQIESELANLAKPINVVAPHPKAVARHLKNVPDLSAMARGGESTSEAAKAIRTLWRASP